MATSPSAALRRPRCLYPLPPRVFDFLAPAWARCASQVAQPRQSPPHIQRRKAIKRQPRSPGTWTRPTEPLVDYRTDPLVVRAPRQKRLGGEPTTSPQAKVVLDLHQKHSDPNEPVDKGWLPLSRHDPERWSPALQHLDPPSGMPALRRARYEAAAKRDALSSTEPASSGLETQEGAFKTAFQEIQRGLDHDKNTRRLSGSSPDPVLVDAFTMAVSRGYAAIALMGPQAEAKVSRGAVTALFRLIRKRFSDLRSSGSDVSNEDWNASRGVLIQVGLQSGVTGFDRWAWEEIAMGQPGCERIVEVWQEIRTRALEKGASSRTQSTDRTITLDDHFFTALVVASSALEGRAPPLFRLMDMLFMTVEASIVRPMSVPSQGRQQLVDPLKSLPNPGRAEHYIRAVELAQLCLSLSDASRRSRSHEHGNTFENMVRNAAKKHQVAYLNDLWSRFREAVDGFEGGPGWIGVDWAEPNSQGAAARSESGDETLDQDVSESQVSEHLLGPEEDLEPDQGSRIASLRFTKTIAGALIRALASGGQTQAAQNAVDWIRRPGPSRPALGMSLYLYSCLIRGLGDAGESELAEAAYHQMVKRDGIVSDIVADCHLLSAFLKGRKIRAPKAPNDNSNNDSPEPPATPFARPSTHDIVLGLQKTEAFLDSPAVRKRYGGTLPIIAYNTILSALLTHGLWDRARSMLDELIASGVKPTVVTFNLFLAKVQRLGRAADGLGEASSLLQKMEELGVKPDGVTMTTLMNVMAATGHRKAVEELLPMMERMGLRANEITYGTVMHQFARTGKAEDLEIGIQLLRMLERRKMWVTRPS